MPFALEIVCISRLVLIETSFEICLVQGSIACINVWWLEYFQRFPHQALYSSWILFYYAFLDVISYSYHDFCQFGVIGG